MKRIPNNTQLNTVSRACFLTPKNKRPTRFTLMGFVAVDEAAKGGNETYPYYTSADDRKGE